MLLCLPITAVTVAVLPQSLAPPEGRMRWNEDWVPLPAFISCQPHPSEPGGFICCAHLNLGEGSGQASQGSPSLEHS